MSEKQREGSAWQSTDSKLHNTEYIENNTTVIITVYGKADTIEKFTVKLMADSDIDFYCQTINNLKLADESWVYAKAVSENSTYTLEDFRPLTFDLILRLEDGAIQKVLRNTDTLDLTKALRGVDPKISDKICNNMSRRAVAMLKEEMNYMGPQSKEVITQAQEKIINTIRHLQETGEIILTEGELP